MTMDRTVLAIGVAALGAHLLNKRAEDQAAERIAGRTRVTRNEVTHLYGGGGGGGGGGNAGVLALPLIPVTKPD